MKHAKDTKNKNFIYSILLIIGVIITLFYYSKLNNKNKNDNNITNIQVNTIATNSNNVKKEEEKTEKILDTYKGYPVIAKLEIPKINLYTDVLSEYSEQALQVSVTKFYGGLPNQAGNFCISGHNYINSNMFRNLKKLEINDEIFLTDGNYGKIEYVVYDMLVVNPNQTECLSQKTNGQTEITLITCTANSEKRIIIKALKKEEWYEKNKK